MRKAAYFKETFGRSHGNKGWSVVRSHVDHVGGPACCDTAMCHIYEAENVKASDGWTTRRKRD